MSEVWLRYYMWRLKRQEMSNNQIKVNGLETTLCVIKWM